MKKIIIRQSPSDPALNTKIMLTAILKGNGTQGKTIGEMAATLDLIDTIEASPNDFLTLKDAEYDLMKTTYENHRFPMNDRYFVDVMKDIKEYTSVSDPKKEKNAK